MKLHKGDIDPDKALLRKSAYPLPHDKMLEGRKTRMLMRQWKLSQFGVNRVELPPCR